jgi:putative endonuclease
MIRPDLVRPMRGCSGILRASLEIARDMNRRGEIWETMACKHLQAVGLDLLTRNFGTRFGELDLVMRDRDVLVFVEVRYRARIRYGDGAASVTASKRARLTIAAEQYLQANPQYAALPCRFDVVSVGGNERTPRIDWLRNAFDAA